MILNERQYKITRARLRDFEGQLESLERDSKLSAQQRGLVERGLRSQVRTLAEELSDYEALQRGEITEIPVTAVSSLGLALIRARIARGLTQAALAGQLGVAEQQVQRYEATRYEGASLERLETIAKRLGIALSGAAAVAATDAHTEPHPEWREPVLVLLLERLEARCGKVVSGRLALQKLVLLLDGALRTQLGWAVFQFQPYRFGGYDAHIDDDLEVLERRLLIKRNVSFHNAPLPDRPSPFPPASVARDFSLSLTAEARAWAATFTTTDDPFASRAVRERVLRIVDEVVERFGTLDATGLIDYTYEHAPDLSARSEIREAVDARRARGAARGGRK